jgi:hypothetical protein
MSKLMRLESQHVNAKKNITKKIDRRHRHRA